jgi:hypothetical protein
MKEKKILKIREDKTKEVQYDNWLQKYMCIYMCIAIVDKYKCVFVVFVYVCILTWIHYTYTHHKETGDRICV